MFRLFTLAVILLIVISVAAIADEIKSVRTSTSNRIDGLPQVLQPVSPDADGFDVLPALDPMVACDGRWQGPAGYVVSGWLWGDEYYAVYQDPAETGCINTYPFDITSVSWQFITEEDDVTMYLQPLIYDYTDPDVIGSAICTGATYEITLATAGNWLASLPIECQVDGPYYAGIYVQTSGLQNIVELVIDDGTTVPPRSDACYNNYRDMWEDLVDDYSHNNLLIWRE